MSEKLIMRQWRLWKVAVTICIGVNIWSFLWTDMICKIDFANGDVNHFLRHLSQALAFDMPVSGHRAPFAGGKSIFNNRHRTTIYPFTTLTARGYMYLSSQPTEPNQ